MKSSILSIIGLEVTSGTTVNPCRLSSSTFFSRPSRPSSSKTTYREFVEVCFMAISMAD